MGADISGGEGNELAWTDGVFLVMGWCERFASPASKPTTATALAAWKDRQRQRFGRLDATAEAVRMADAAVPRTFAEAKVAGFVPDGRRNGSFDEDGFDQCRRFLAEAARRGAAIDGSF